MATKSATSSKRGKLMGSQEPSVRIAPKSKETDGKDAAKLLGAAGLKVDPWQANALCDWMGRDRWDVWTAPTCGLSVPRQNGKTCVVSGRAAAGMLLYNEWIIYTAHLQKTATETFMEIRGLFESDAMKDYVAEIKGALGREQIILKNGGRIMFVARTRNGGRGLHGDCLIFDEAQEVTPEQLGSFLPALSASKNPQTIYIGTPPDENCCGDVFRQVRQKAVDGESKQTAWSEFSVKEIGDIKDRERWAKTNPALGRRIRESTIAAECEQMAPDLFARERLGWWSPIIEKKDEYAIEKAAWDKCASNEKKPEGKTAYGVKFSADGTEVSLCGAVIDTNGIARISLIDRKPTIAGVKWLADWLNERYSKACCVVIDGRNGVDVLVDKIAKTWKFKDAIVRANTKTMMAAVSTLTNEIAEQTLTWYKPQTMLNESAVTSIKRPLLGGWAFGGENSTPIEACALALWGARTSKRDPTKRMRIG